MGVCERSSRQQSHRWSPRAKKLIFFFRENDIWGRIFINVVSLKYIGMIYTNVGEMCLIPMNIHNELFNGVRHLLRWQHLSPVVSTFSTSIRLLSSFFIKHCILPPLSLRFCPPVYMYLFSFCDTHPVFLISGLSLRFGDGDVFFLQSNVFCN